MIFIPLLFNYRLIYFNGLGLNHRIVESFGGDASIAFGGAIHQPIVNYSPTDSGGNRLRLFRVDEAACFSILKPLVATSCVRLDRERTHHHSFEQRGADGIADAQANGYARTSMQT